MKEEIEAMREISLDGRLREAAQQLEGILNYASMSFKVRRPKPWFDQECYKERKRVLNLQWERKQRSTQENTNRYCEARQKYKTLLK
jgi:hypothetical protein